MGCPHSLVWSAITFFSNTTAGSPPTSATADGKTLVTTPTIHGHQPATPIDVDVTGAQVLDLIVGDAGDGNGNDHGDWAVPTLTCT